MLQIGFRHYEVWWYTLRTSVWVDAFCLGTWNLRDGATATVHCPATWIIPSLQQAAHWWTRFLWDAVFVTRWPGGSSYPIRRHSVTPTTHPWPLKRNRHWTLSGSSSPNAETGTAPKRNYVGRVKWGVVALLTVLFFQSRHASHNKGPCDLSSRYSGFLC